MFQDGLAGVTVFVGAMGAARQVVLDPHSPPPRPDSLGVPCAHQAPGARGEPVPDWFRCSQPCPAGREALRSITPELTQTPAFR